MDQIYPNKKELYATYIDDILITGKNDQQHLGNLKAVLASKATTAPTKNKKILSVAFFKTR